MIEGSYINIAIKQLYIRSKHLGKFVVTTALFLSVFTQITPVFAETPVRFDIPENSADKGLRLYAEQAGRQVLFPYDLMRKKTTNAVAGMYKADEALDILLSETGLGVFSSSKGTLTIMTLDKVEEYSKMKDTKKRWGGLTVLASLFVTSNAVSTHASATTLEEVVVTAQKREQNLQDIPIAISAVTGDTIEKADIHDLTDIATRVPSLTYSPFSPSQNVIALRGVSSNADGAGTDNSVAVFVDGVYSGLVSNVNPEIFDVEGVEVLRGPQGTLYGKNTIGGAIVIRSKKPNTEEFEGKVKVDLGNYSRRNFSGLVTGPISDSWAAKLSVASRKRDGWVENVVLNKQQKDENTQSYRGQLLYTGDKAEVLISADYSDLDVEDMARIPLTQGNGGPIPFLDVRASFCGDRGPECSTNPTDGFAKREAQGGSVQVDYDLDWAELTSITAYRKNEARWLMDSLGAGVAISDNIRDDSEQFTQELRLAGELDNGANYVIGLWYSTEEIDRTEAFDAGPIIGDLDVTSQYTQVNETTSYALFGQYDLDLSDKLSLSLGARYSYDEKEIDNIAQAGDFPAIGETFTNSRNDDWSAFTPKVALRYQVNDNISTYASIAEGFKSGGYAAAPQTIVDTEPLDPEKSLNYELGMKADLLGNTLRLNTAIFYTEYEDLQFQQFGPRPEFPGEFGIFRTVNLAESEAKGLELEFTWLPIENLMISGAYGYLDTEYIDAVIPTSGFPIQNGQDMIRAPKNKYSLNAEYIWPFASGAELSFNLGYSFTDDQRGELEPFAIQPEFDLIDARIGWTSADDSLELSLWGKNLADEDHVVHVYTLAAEAMGVFGDPRMYGFSATYKF